MFITVFKKARYTSLS